MAERDARGGERVVNEKKGGENRTEDDKGMGKDRITKGAKKNDVME